MPTSPCLAVSVALISCSPSHAFDDEVAIVRDPAAAQAIVERALERCGELQSYADEQTFAWRVDVEGAQASALRQRMNRSGQSTVTREGRFDVSVGNYRAVCDGVTCWLQDTELGQYVEVDLDEIAVPVSDWLRQHTSDQLSLPLAGRLIVDGDAGLFDDTTLSPTYVGVRPAEREGRAGSWVIVEHADPWYRSGEMIRVEMWFDAEDGLLRETRADLTDAYRLATLAHMNTWDMAEDDIPRINSATLVATTDALEIDEPMDDSRFAFPGGGADERVARLGEHAWSLETEIHMRTGLESPALLAQIGEPVRTRGMADVAGAEIDLADSRGKIVLLYFWMMPYDEDAMGDDTPTAIHQMIKKVQARFGAANVDAIGVCSHTAHTPEEIQAWLDDADIGIRQILDSFGEVARHFHVGSFPCTILIDDAGIVRDIMSSSGPEVRAHLETRVELARAGAPVVSAEEIAIRTRVADERAARYEAAMPPTEKPIEVAEREDDRLVQLDRVVTGNVTSVAVPFDVDRDGDDELVVAGGAGGLSIVSADGSSIERVRLRTRGQVQELEPVWFDGTLHWFASSMDWQRLDGHPEIGLFARDGTVAWTADLPQSVGELDEGQTVSTQAMLHTGDLDGDGEPELIIGLNYVVWTDTGDDSFAHGSNETALVLVLDKNGHVLSQTDVGAPIILLHVASPARDDDVASLVCWTMTEMLRYRLDATDGP